MGWVKALIIGLCIYVGIYIVSFLVFVNFGLGYKFSNFANKISEILAFPFGTGKNYNPILSALFWTVIIGTILKTLSFYKK